MITRESWRARWLDSLNELMSLDLQKISWLDIHNTNPHWSFVEFCCVYFDDLLCDFPYSHYVEIDWISPQEYEVIKDWHATLDAYEPPGNDNHDHFAIINDPRWLAIINAGNIARHNLSGMLEENERQILNAKFSYYLQYSLPREAVLIFTLPRKSQ